MLKWTEIGFDKEEDSTVEGVERGEEKTCFGLIPITIALCSTLFVPHAEQGKTKTSSSSGLGLGKTVDRGGVRYSSERKREN